MSTEHNQLKKNALSTWDVISQSLAFLGPVMSICLGEVGTGRTREALAAFGRGY